MRSVKSSGPPKKPRLLIIRRVSGDSMRPGLKPGQVVIGTKLIKPKLGKLVIIRHDDLEKIKRLTKIADQKLYVLGDNGDASTDSRQFGWIDKDQLLATVIWPKK